jgi:phosphotransferase system HPr-like phosphotransfer protein
MISKEININHDFSIRDIYSIVNKLNKYQQYSIYLKDEDSGCINLQSMLGLLYFRNKLKKGNKIIIMGNIPESIFLDIDKIFEVMDE